MYVALDTAKNHLRIEQSYTEDDNYITLLISVAEERAAKELCMRVEELSTLSDNGIPDGVVMAILLIVGGYYANREEITAVQTKPLEGGALHLLRLYRNYEK